MRYEILKDNYCNFNVFEDNKLEGRSYFIPYKNIEVLKTTDLMNERYNSEKVICLNGEWDFKYYKKLQDIPQVLDTDKEIFDKITVPSMWQMTGYENPFYINANYQFLRKIPQIPTTDPVGKYTTMVEGKNVDLNLQDCYNSKGIYRKIVNIDDLNKKYIISFLGVSSCLELYVNGQYVGYSEGSHNTAEFDIDKFLILGQNEILVLVHKWCNGTYLEAQDMFRSNGIFRDVLLFVNEKNFIYDYSIKTQKTQDGYCLDISIVKLGDSALTLEAVMYEKDEEVFLLKDNITHKLALHKNLEKIKEWSAEEPNLYQLYLILRNSSGDILEVIRTDIGFRTIEINGECFLFNGKKIKVKGVNHHDSNPKTGYYMTPQNIFTDLSLMKDYNVNTVRTSHYPPDPLFMQLCNRLGLYVIDEADIETHGVNCKPFNDIHKISRDLKWKEHYWDRISRMYFRDKNNVSVLMWSFGNESGGYQCQDYCYKKLKALCPEIPLHYEGVIHSKRMSYDVHSEMYTEFDYLCDIRDHKMAFDGQNKLIAKFKYAYFKKVYPMAWQKSCGYGGKPYLICEYAHAMGVGPGGLEDYWDIIYSSDQLMGGCIWEFCDHAIYHDSGNYKYTYGGDHGEYIHSGNFCVDGLFYADRRPHTGALSMKYVYRPLRAVCKEGKIIISNTNSFKNSDYIEIVCEFVVDKNVVTVDILNLAILPGDSYAIDVNHYYKCADYCNISYIDKNTQKEIAKEQIILNLPSLNSNFSKHTQFVLDNGNYVAKLHNGEIKINATTGEIVSIISNNKELINQFPTNKYNLKGGYINIFRAPIDNDMYIKKEWKKVGYFDYTQTLTEVSVVDDQLSIKWDLSCGTQQLFEITENYKICDEKGILIRYDLIPKKSKLCTLPKFGRTFELLEQLQYIEYFGRGAGENYSDIKNHAVLGNYSAKVSDMFEPYLKPQENGNRCDCQFVKALDNDGVGIQVTAVGTPFNFSAKTIHDSDLAKCNHLEDIKSCQATILNIDGFMRGVGSNSCGPQVAKKYAINDGNLTYSIFLEIIN